LWEALADQLPLAVLQREAGDDQGSPKVVIRWTT
jgi:hypothetical protein